jgi:hypothetical protein
MLGEDVRKIALDLPCAVEALSGDIRSFTVRKKLFLRILDDDRAVVLRTDYFERDHLLATMPDVFHVTDRIREHPWVFARLAEADGEQLRQLIIDAWRRAAPPTVVRRFDGA